MSVEAPPVRARAIGAALVVTMLATVFSLCLGFVVKDRCTTHVWDGYQYRTSCYNDIFSLFFFRGFADGKFPYVHGDGIDAGTTDHDGDLEYPVGTGLFVGGMAAALHGGRSALRALGAPLGHVVPQAQEFFRVNAAGLAALGLACAALLYAMVRDKRRVLFFALAPSLVLYAFHNWDLVAVFALCAGLYAFSRGADGWSGTLLGLGAAAKLFPGFVLPALVLARWRKTGRFPLRLISFTVGSFVVVNLPVLFINPRGWWFPWKFQSTRFPNFETSWYMIYRHFGSNAWFRTYPAVTSYVPALLFAAGIILLVRAESRREHIRPHALGFGILLVFLLSAKVYSPQYALWVLPFFVLVRVPWQAWLAFTITDAAVWAAISGFFLASGANNGESAWLWAVEGTVYARYAVLAWLLWYSRRAVENTSEVPSQLTRVHLPA